MEELGHQPRIGRVATRAMLIAGGLAVGSITAVGARLSSANGLIAVISHAQQTEYVEIGTVVLPMVDDDGDLVRYIAVKAALEVSLGSGDLARSKLPAVLHQINLASSQSPLPAAPDPRLVDRKLIAEMLQRATLKVYGPALPIRRLLLRSIAPA